MKITVLGTGAADGTPQPFCRCATCMEARATGQQRQPGGVLVDDALLIDAPGTLGAAAARAGADLTGVHTIAVTHAHHDHWDPAVLLHRSWQTDAKLRIIGPAAVLASAREWVAPDAQIEFVEARPGVVVSTGDYVLRALPSTHGIAGTDVLADEAVLYDVTRIEDGGRLLYGADTGPLDPKCLAAVAEAAFDVVLLELTFGARGPRTPGHLDHDSFPVALEALRTVGAIDADTIVAPIHVSHHNPPRAALADAADSWGVRLVDDGTTLDTHNRLIHGHRRAHVTFVTGGARSGKSHYAEQSAGHGEVQYLATGLPTGLDPEWDARVQAHVARRPVSWTTIETADAAAALGACPRGATVLLDCLGLWLTRLIDDAGAWADAAIARHVATEESQRLLAAIEESPAARIIVVSNEVGSGVVPATAAGSLFRDLLGRVNAAVSAAADDAVLMVAGRPLPLHSGVRAHVPAGLDGA